MPDSVSNSDIDAILRRQISSVAAQEKCERNDPNEISAYLEGALSSKRVADFEQHLVNCAICRRAVIELRALDDEEESPISDTAKAELKTDKTHINVPSLGIVERLRKLLFGSGGSGYIWRPAAALVMILLIVGAPAILFLRQTRQGVDTHNVAQSNKSEKPAEDKLADADSNANFSDGATNGAIAQNREQTAGKAVEPAPPGQPSNEPKRDAAGQPSGVAGNAPGAGPPADATAAAPPPPPPLTVVASAPNPNKDESPPKKSEEKQSRDAELDKLQREAERSSVSNSAYGVTLTWNVTVTMTPVETRSAFALSDGRRAADLPDRSGGGARGGQTEQPPASAKTAPKGKNTEDRDTTTRADDAKRKETVAKKPADSPVPYDKRVGQILKARFDKLMEDKVRSGTGVTVKIRIGPDGSVISLKDGKVLDSDIIKRSSNDVVNAAVLKAITEGKLPAFGENEKDYSQVILTIKFEPTVN